jgi:hypothetical protein|tara:strand:- start:525 stop:1121 length:597 start_codon:yes stop_codon:yes gene_type:complete
MSSDGTRVAIGAYGNGGALRDVGHVRVYAESGGAWTQVGEDIDDEAAGDFSGDKVSMSSDGTRVAIGASVLLVTTATASAPATCGCTPRAAEHGPRVAPTSTAGLRATTPGGSVSMSSDGTRVAIGSPSSSDFFDKSAHSKAGYVRVLQLQEQEQDNSARAVIWICIVIGILLVLGWASRRNQPCQRRTIINSGASQL